MMEWEDWVLTLGCRPSRWRASRLYRSAIFFKHEPICTSAMRVGVDNKMPAMAGCRAGSIEQGSSL